MLAPVVLVLWLRVRPGRVPGVVAIMVVVVVGLWDTVDSLAKHRKVRTWPGLVGQPARSASPA